jgi:hypothetical protein
LPSDGETFLVGIFDSGDDRASFVSQRLDGIEPRAIGLPIRESVHVTGDNSG